MLICLMIFAKSSFAEFQRFAHEVYGLNHNGDAESNLFNSAARRIVHSLDWLQDEVMFILSNI